MPHLLILLCHKKKKKKRRGRLVFLRSKPSVCLELVNTAWRLKRVGTDRESRAGGVKCPGSDAFREHTEEREKSGVRKEWPGEVGKQNSWDGRTPIKNRTRH